MENEKLVDLGPFTLDEAKDWLHKLEDEKWDAFSRAGALEFMLGNLLIELNKENVIAGLPFIQKLQALLPLQPEAYKTSAEQILGRLRLSLSNDDKDGYALH